MYVKRLRVDGLRGFSGSRAVDLDLTRPDGSHAGWTVLAGRNGSGKTSLLQALAVGLGWEPGSFWRAAPGAAIAVTLTLDAADRAWLGLPEGPPGVAELECLTRWLPAARGPRGRLRRRRSHVLRDAAGVATVLDSDDLAGQLVEWVVGAGAHRRLGTRVVTTTQMGGLFDEDEVLSEGVSMLVELDHRARNGDADARRELEGLLALLADGLLPDGHRPVAVDADGLWVERGGRRYVLRQLSDGLRAAVALVLHLSYGLEPRIVLVDEIDAHLHVSWQQRIGPWLTEHFPRTQFLVSTHSPYICQAADPGGLIRLAGPDEDGPPRVVAEELYRRVVYGSGDDAVLSDLFGLESPYSAQAERLRRRVGDLEADVLSGEAGEAELEEYRELSERLTSSTAARVDEVAARLARGE